jgi:hypothetical protein
VARDLRGRTAVYARELLTTPKVPAVGGVSPSQVAARPAAFMNRHIVTRGEVTAVVGQSGFVLEDDLLVLSPRRTRPPLDRGDEVTAVGRVRKIDPDQVPRREPAEIDEELFGEVIRRPVVNARSVTVVGPPGSPGGTP